MVATYIVHNIIFEHLRENITSVREEKTSTAINIDFFEDARKHATLKSLAHIFQVAFHFYPDHPQPKRIVNSSKKTIANKTLPLLFSFLASQIYILAGSRKTVFYFFYQINA